MGLEPGIPSELGGMARVTPLPLVTPPISRREEHPELNPGEIRRIISGGLPGTLLPCIDSRAPHWRYYLIASPRNTHQSSDRLGALLHRILKRNRGFNGGIGRRYFNSTNRVSHRRLCKIYWSRYSTVNRKFWQLATDVGGRDLQTLMRRAQKLRSGASVADFFQLPENETASAAFHRMLLRQSDEAEELARLFRATSRSYQRDRSLADAILTGLKRARLSARSRQLVFSMALIYSLFRTPAFSAAGQEEHELLRFSQKELHSLARLCTRWLVDDDDIRDLLPNSTRNKILHILRVALRDGTSDYLPPLSPPAWMVRVFSDNKLALYWRMLGDTVE